MRRKVSSVRRTGPVAAAAAAAAAANANSTAESTRSRPDAWSQRSYYTRPPLTAGALYKLKTDDGHIFEVERILTKQSKLITDHWIDNSITDQNCAQAAPLELPFPAPIIAMILEWLNHHKHDRPPRTKRRVPYRDFSVWDKSFLDVEPGLLFAMLNASYHLGIEELMNMGCAAAAELIRGKSTEEIREIYGIRSDEEAAADGEPGPSGLNNFEVN